MAYVCIEEIGVHNDTFDVGQIFVVLQRLEEINRSAHLLFRERTERAYPLHQTCFLTQVGNAGSVVMGEHFVAEDSICHLRSVHKVHLEQASLQVSLFRQVVLQSLEQELRSLLDHAL